LGISVGGAAAATVFVAALGGPIVFAVGIAILLGGILKFIFGKAWQKMLAEKFVEKWNEQNFTSQNLSRVEKFWGDTVTAQNAGIDGLLNRFQERINIYRDLADYRNKDQHIANLKIAESMKSFFDNLPLS
jgi:hypothetical protein